MIHATPAESRQPGSQERSCTRYTYTPRTECCLAEGVLRAGGDCLVAALPAMTQRERFMSLRAKRSNPSPVGRAAHNFPLWTADCKRLSSQCSSAWYAPDELRHRRCE